MDPNSSGIEDVHNALLRIRDRTNDPDSTLFQPRLSAKLCKHKHLIANMLSDVEWMFEEDSQMAFRRQEERAVILEDTVELIVKGESFQSFLRRGIGNYFKNGLEHRRKDLEELMWKLIGLHDDCLDDVCLRQPDENNVAAMRSTGKRRSLDIKEDEISFYEAVRENIDFVEKIIQEWEPSGKCAEVCRLVREMKPEIQAEIIQLLLHRKHITFEILEMVIKGVANKVVPGEASNQVKTGVVLYLANSMRHSRGKLRIVTDKVLRSHRMFCNENCKEEGHWNVSKRRRLF